MKQPPSSPLAPLYLDRLGLGQADLDEDATSAKLFTVVEAHLKHIPFENLAQHGAVGGTVVLDIPTMVEKMLRRKRGGFCVELNGLLAELLLEWGYQVTRVPAHVYMGPVDGFSNQPVPTHVVLMVSTPPSKSEPESSTWFVDVGFGEPALNPLFYEVGGMEQTTPEGIMSRFVHCGEEDVVLEWYLNDSWTPRLKWKAEAVTSGGVELQDFAKALAHVQGPGSPFSKKIIVCRLTRDEKVTLSGCNLKRTGPPRFPKTTQANSNVLPPITNTTLETVDEVRKVLEEEFGMPMKETEGLDLTKSNQAPAGLWRQL